MNSGEASIKLVNDVIANYNENLPDPEDPRIEADDELFGDHGKLDSVEILQIISLIEQEIEASTGNTLMLLDHYSEYSDTIDKSPFQTITSLQKYVDWVLSKNL